MLNQNFIILSQKKSYIILSIVEVILEKLSNLLGKPLINIYDGKLEGYIKNALIDKKLNKIVWLEVFDDKNSCEKFASIKDVFSFDGDAVMIKNGENIFLSNTIIPSEVNPINYKVFCTNGSFDSKIVDVEFDNNFSVKNLQTQNGILCKKDVLVLGFDVVIKKDSKCVKLSAFKPKAQIKQNAKKSQDVVSIQSTLSPVSKVSTKIYPQKILTSNYDFLLGRKVGQNIYSENGQLIAKRQSKITSQVIDTASKNGKLKELTTYSII